MQSVSSSTENELTNYYRNALSEQEDQHRTEMRKLREGNDEQTRKLQDNYESSFQKSEEDSSEALKNMKEAASDSLSRERVGSKAELEQVKKQLYNNRGQVTNTVPMEIYRKEIQDLENSGKTRHERDIDSLSNIEDRLRHQIRDVNRETDDRIRDLTSQHNEKTAELGEQIKTLSGYNEKISRDKAESNSTWIRDNENANRAEMRRLEETYNNHLGKIQQNVKERESHSGDSKNQLIQEKENEHAAQVRALTEENREQLRQLEMTFEGQVAQSDAQRKKLENDSTEAMSRTRDLAHQDRDNALESQAKTYNDFIERNRVIGQTEIDTLQKALKQKNSSDPDAISPAAEANLRNALLRENGKLLNTEIEKNKANTEDLHRKFTDRYREVKEDSADRETTLIHQNAQERETERSQALDAIQETNYQAQNKITTQQTDFDRERDSLLRQFSRVMERQKREFDQVFETSRADSALKFSAYRSEAEFNSKMAQRAFATQKNELIRDYEKRLVEQKAQFEVKLEDFHLESQQQIKDVERRSKQELELQGKGYEQKIAQLEAQGKERERAVAQSYQDELERTKRSYELLGKKKS